MDRVGAIDASQQGRVEFIPMIDMLPTWTACVALVVTLRKKQQTNTPPREGPVIDV